MIRSLSKPFQTVFRWQLLATAALALVGGILAGANGALSAALGGLVSVLAGLASAVLASKRRSTTAGGVLLGALLAEGVRIGLVAMLLAVVLLAYGGVVVPALIGSFTLTMLLFSMAFFVREH